MAIGIDIGSTYIKAVEIDGKPGSYVLRGAGIIGHNHPRPEQVKEHKEMADLADTVRKLHSTARLSSKNVNISLPEAHVFTRILKYPLISDHEVAAAIKWEAEQYIPIPVEDAIVQHEILRKDHKASPPQSIVLLIAAPRHLVEMYVKLVEMAKLRLASIETEMLSNVRSSSSPQGVSMVVDLGSKHTKLAIANNSEIAVTRTFNSSGDAFNRALSQGLGVDMKQAEQYKKTYGLAGGDKSGKIKASLDPVVDLIADEIKKSIAYYKSEEGGSPPQDILLTGGSSLLPGLVSELSSKVGQNVSLVDPFSQSKIQLNSDVNKTIRGFAGMYSVALGLAMREGQ